MLGLWVFKQEIDTTTLLIDSGEVYLWTNVA